MISERLDDEVDVAAVERLARVGQARDDLDRQPGCIGREPADERADEHEDRVVRAAHAERAAVVRRVERRGRLDRAADERERLADGPGQRLGARGRDEGGAVADEQGIAEHHAQPGERVAHARLAEPDPVGGARDAALAQERVESHEEVEVDPAQLHCHMNIAHHEIQWSHDRRAGVASPDMADEEIDGPDHRRQPRRAHHRDAAGPSRRAVALRRASRGNRDPPARRALPAAHDGDPAPGRAGGRARARRRCARTTRAAGSTRSSRSPAASSRSTSPT